MNKINDLARQNGENSGKIRNTAAMKMTEFPIISMILILRKTLSHDEKHCAFVHS
jgi:hypothetical protein